MINFQPAYEYFISLLATLLIFLLVTEKKELIVNFFSSLAGLGLGPGSPLAISLGSSDTVMAWLQGYPYHSDDGLQEPLNGSVFVNPVDTNVYMSLLW